MDEYHQSLSAKKIEEMSYVDFISLLRETNRCPGGKRTIQKIINKTFIDSNSHVLEVGSNTGFTSLEIARVSKARVLGIDVVETAVNEARRALSSDTSEIQGRVQFEVASALDIPSKNDMFDLVVVGGATSFVSEKRKVIDEYYRVVKPWGFLSVTNLCYLESPPVKLVKKVSDVIGVEIKPWTFNQWSELFQDQSQFEIYEQKKYSIESMKEEDIEKFVEYFINKPHIKTLKIDVKQAIEKRWFETMQIFNENHKYLGFMFLILRKRFLPEEPEFFSRFSLVK